MGAVLTHHLRMPQNCRFPLPPEKRHGKRAGQRSPCYHLWSEALIFTNKSTFYHACDMYCDHACVIISDQKPLTIYFFCESKETTVMTSARIQHLVLLLRAYEYHIKLKGLRLGYTIYSRHPSCRLKSSFFLR